jgi:hypothetical protein
MITNTDEVIASIRNARHEISEEGGHDVHRVVALYRQFQQSLKQQGNYRIVDLGQEDSCALKNEERS